MLELPKLTPEHFEILVVRELRKVGLEVSELRIHRRVTSPEPEEGYLLELKGVITPDSTITAGRSRSRRASLARRLRPSASTVATGR